jgi:hypothetical protein
MRTSHFLVCLSVAFLAVAVGSVRADTILWYNGDLPSGGGGTVNEQTSNVGESVVYDDFTITDPSGWTIDRLWSNNSMQITGVNQASWTIRLGMSVGNGGTVVSSGIGLATQLPTGRSNPIVGFPEYSVQISGLNITLQPGTYWLSVAPLVGNDSGGVLKSYLSRTSGANAIGTPPGNDGNSFFNSPWLGYNYATAFLSDYSMGVAGTVIPEPSSGLLVVGGGLALIALRRGSRA